MLASRGNLSSIVAFYSIVVHKDRVVAAVTEDAPSFLILAGVFTQLKENYWDSTDTSGDVLCFFKPTRATAEIIKTAPIT